MRLLVEHGMLLQSAKGPIPNVADLVAGEPIKGSWWGHPCGREIYAVLGELDDAADVVRTRVVNGKVTFVHRRLWPALVRVHDRFEPSRLAAIREEHTRSGAHRKVETPFPAWVPPDVQDAARALSETDALEALPACLRS